MEKLFKNTRQHWSNLNLYERFEQIVSLILTFFVSATIVVALWNLFMTLVDLIASGEINPSQPETFQTIFGMMMIVLIALEFNHSLVSVVERGRSIVQVRTVVLIALLAVLRKFIIIEIGETETALLFALAASALALGGVFWALRSQDRAIQADKSETL